MWSRWTARAMSCRPPRRSPEVRGLRRSPPDDGPWQSGANTAIFSLVNALMAALAPGGHPEPCCSRCLWKYPEISAPATDYRWRSRKHVRGRTTCFTDLICHVARGVFQVTGGTLGLSRVWAYMLPGNFFRCSRPRPADSAGLIGPQEDQIGSPARQGAVISDPRPACVALASDRSHTA